ncbi:MAG: flavin reductase family protein [Pararhodobacter sp.]
MTDRAQVTEFKEDSFVPAGENSRRFRDALGRFATGVTVITTRSTGPQAGQPVGITANSFAALSLDPPLVLWSPARSSRRFDSFAQARHFVIHVLAQDQAALGRHFSADGYDFDLPGITENAEGVPVLPHCLARFDCATEAVHPGGDHALVVGRVLRAVEQAGAPLVFSGGLYGGFAAD